MKKWSKKIMIVFFLSIVVFWTFVEMANRDSKNMTTRQKILKAVYPVWVWFAGKKGLNAGIVAHGKVVPKVSFYSLQDSTIDGLAFDFKKLKDKKVMLVNSASDCGYTGQYDDLQKLSETYAGKLVILGFPSNDFKDQEKGSDKEIAAFCRLNFGVTFPLMKKSRVKKGAGQNPVFEWLTDPEKNGWNSQPPAWNFCKYIVDEEGRLTHYFESTIKPGGPEITDVLNH